MTSNELVRLLDKTTGKEITVRPGDTIEVPTGDYVSLNYVRLVENNKTVGVWQPGENVSLVGKTTSKTDLEELTVSELKQIMRDQGKSLKRNMTKEELLEAINA